MALSFKTRIYKDAPSLHCNEEIASSQRALLAMTFKQNKKNDSDTPRLEE
jgi:hypothetical protein